MEDQPPKHFNQLHAQRDFLTDSFFLQCSPEYPASSQPEEQTGEALIPSPWPEHHDFIQTSRAPGPLSAGEELTSERFLDQPPPALRKHLPGGPPMMGRLAQRTKNEEKKTSAMLERLYNKLGPPLHVAFDAPTMAFPPTYSLLRSSRASRG